MHVNLNSPAIGAGRITAADLAAARQHSTGRILHLRRATVMPAGLDQQGRHATRDWQWPDTICTDHAALDDCAPEGGTHADPVASMARHRHTVATLRWGFALALLLVVCGYLGRAIWPLLA